MAAAAPVQVCRTAAVEAVAAAVGVAGNASVGRDALVQRTRYFFWSAPLTAVCTNSKNVLHAPNKPAKILGHSCQLKCGAATGALGHRRPR